MKKTDAFRHFGYNHYKATRGVWSAEKDGAVLVTLWHQQMRYDCSSEGLGLYVDLDELHPAGDPDRDEIVANPRLRTRADRIKKAMNDHRLNLDIVVLFGPVGNDKGDAEPWVPAKQNNLVWRPVWVRQSDNFFRMEAR